MIVQSNPVYSATCASVLHSKVEAIGVGRGLEGESSCKCFSVIRTENLQFIWQVIVRIGSCSVIWSISLIKVHSGLQCVAPIGQVDNTAGVVIGNIHIDLPGLKVPDVLCEDPVVLWLCRPSVVTNSKLFPAE